MNREQLEADFAARFAVRNGNERIKGQIYGFTGTDPVLGQKFYGGRAFARYGLPDTPLGNYSYKVTTHTYEEHRKAVDAYQRDFDRAMQNPDSGVARSVDRLSDRLVKGEKFVVTCWCPENLPCHVREVVKPAVIEQAIDKVIEIDKEADMRSEPVQANLFVMAEEQDGTYVCDVALADATGSMIVARSFTEGKSTIEALALGTLEGFTVADTLGVTELSVFADKALVDRVLSDRMELSGPVGDAICDIRYETEHLFDKVELEELQEARARKDLAFTMQDHREGKITGWKVFQPTWIPEGVDIGPLAPKRPLEESSKALTVAVKSIASYGSSSAGVVLGEENHIYSSARYIPSQPGMQTHNQAEYQAIVAGLKEALDWQATSVTVLSDNKLVVDQINGNAKTKDPVLSALLSEVKQFSAQFESVMVINEPQRGVIQTKVAHNLAKDALSELQAQVAGTWDDAVIGEPVWKQAEGAPSKPQIQSSLEPPSVDLKEHGGQGRILILSEGDVETMFERGNYSLPDVVISIGTPGNPTPAAFEDLGDERLRRFQFLDAREGKGQIPAADDLIDALMAARDALGDDKTLLIQCEAGRSRSTAIALAILCDQLDEEEAIDVLEKLQPDALPNGRIVALTDALLGTSLSEILPYAKGIEPTEQDWQAIEAFQQAERDADPLGHLRLEDHDWSQAIVVSNGKLSPCQEAPFVYQGNRYESVEDAYLANKGQCSDNAERKELMASLIANQLLFHRDQLDSLKAPGTDRWIAGLQFEVPESSKLAKVWGGQGVDSPYIACLLEGIEKAKTLEQMLDRRPPAMATGAPGKSKSKPKTKPEFELGR